MKNLESPPLKQLVQDASEIPRVQRSAAPAGKDYTEYKPYLRHDFFYTCAYCTTSEAEATAIRFCIDHYEPRGARPDLTHEYLNLMYACDACNTRKGDRCPPSEARLDGYRFYRPDEDRFSDHFVIVDIRLVHKSNTGFYTIEALDLNRHSLRKIRELRMRLSKCDRFISEGLVGLRNFKIDRLPAHIRGRANKAIKDIDKFAGTLVDKLDDLLRENAKSELVDDDPDVALRGKERQHALNCLGILYPGSWRGPRKTGRTS